MDQRASKVARCRVCGSASVTPVILEEMMFGSREPFEYLECGSCASLSIAEVPRNLGDHYPSTYYSFQTGHKGRFGFWTRRIAVLALLNLPAPLISRLPPELSMWRGMRLASVKPSTRILDVGCGNGARLKSLERSGFSDLHGVDPFIEQGETLPHITITQGEARDLDGTYEFILLSHSLEHMADPLAALHDVARICAPGGHVLIGVPVANRSWRELGPDWAGLDPPRHLFVPSVSALTSLIELVPGLRVKKGWFDTTSLEFSGSQLAKLRVALFDRATGTATDPARYFDEAQRAAWASQARDYNRLGDAGTASFLVERE